MLTVIPNSCFILNRIELAIAEPSPQSKVEPVTSIQFSSMPKGSIWISSALLPVVNTGVFCVGMLLFYRGYLSPDNAMGFKDYFYTVFIVIAGVNFLIEFLNIE